MKIKVCGMRDSVNITELVKLSPDYIGFIFYDKSKRFVADFPEVEIPSSIKKVGVFVNESIENILNKISDFKLDVVQLHGNETSEFCKELQCQFERSRELKIIKAFAIGKDFNFNKTKAYEQVCDLFIFDTKGKEYGGNGVKYDWSILQNYKGETPYLLSGGISEDDALNVLSLLRNKKSNQCVGVDLNSGFEERPALKNITKLAEFKKQLSINDALVLKSKEITLRILRNEDLDELHKTVVNESIWDYFPVVLSDKEVLKDWISNQLKLFYKHEWIPFVIIDNATNQIIGSTSFLAISFYHKRVEIGATWFKKELQGKGFNKLSKYLLLTYGFESLGLERIELKTDRLNTQSLKAIQKIGATEEGVLRSHMTMPRNRRRDTVYFSIISKEWKNIKSKIFKESSNEI